MNKPLAMPCVRLPRLAAGDGSWRLPISDFGAYELAHLLVLDDAGQRTALAAQVMSIDPALTLWTACLWHRSGESAAAAPRCVMDLAQFLARHATEHLRWVADDLLPQPKPSRRGRESRARWRELAADAVAVANLAAEPAADDAVAAELFLLGLLHNAADWLHSVGPRISILKGQFGCLPQWLGQQLRERSRAPSQSPLGQVLQALRRWRESGRRNRQVDGVDVTDALVARRRWQAPGSALESGRGLLVALTAKLQTLQRLEGDFQRTLEQEKLASLGELAYGASHEINNPLANISTRAQALMSNETDAERRRMLAIINSQAFRANEMIADMMLFARPPALVCEVIDLEPLVEELIAELQPDAALQGTELVTVSGAGPVWVSADRAQLGLALRAVLLNALQALGAEGRVTLQVAETADGAPGTLCGTADTVQITMRDNGPGMSPQVRRHLFDPFYSGREAGRGLGFGMAKCWRIVTLHGGGIEVATAPQQGTSVMITLPRAAAPRDEVQQAEAAGESHAGDELHDRSGIQQ